MPYHASGKPTLRTGSIVVVTDVRVTPRYGNGISASAYAREDRNGMSRGIVRDVPVRKGTRKVRAPKTRVWVNPALIASRDNAKERRTAGVIRMGEMD